MKISITGHTQGIGAALVTYFEAQGHTVLKFSRSNGYDISQESDRDRIVEESRDCDVFINNATHEFAQTYLLFKFHDMWAGQDKTIINLSSHATERWFNVHQDHRVRTFKRSLDDSSYYLRNLNPLPNIMLLNLCIIDTPRSDHLSSEIIPQKVSPESLAKFIDVCLTNPDFKIFHVTMGNHGGDARTAMRMENADLSYIGR